MDREVSEKIEKYVMNAFNAVHSKAAIATTRKLAARSKLSLTGNLVSSASFWETVEIKAEHIKLLVEARTRAMMDAYEMHGVDLDDSILHDAKKIYENMLGAAAAEIARDPVLSRLGSNVQSDALVLLQRHTGALIYELTCELERRKAVQRKKPEYSTMIELHGANARANINSIDNSVNSVTITEQNVFSETRNTIRAEVPEAEQAQILERLAALENSIHKLTGMQKYKEFAALAVEYGKLLPLLPKLLEMAKQVVHSL